MTDDEFFDRFGHADNFINVEDARKGIAVLRCMLDEGSGRAGFLLAMYTEGMIANRDDVREFLTTLHNLDECVELYRRSFPLLHWEAENGSTLAMNFLSISYQCGIPPAPRDLEMMRYWDTRCHPAYP